MKKLITLIGMTLLASVIFAASYTNNTYQKLAKEYLLKAEKALDAGEYALSEEYAQKAKENADLSDAYIASMKARDAASKDMTLAQNRLDYVKSIRGDVNFPLAYETAEKSMANANEAFSKEEWTVAQSCAKTVLEILAEVREITPLPKYYIVKPWATDRDCFWNISGRPYVYANPFLWENLYEANKKALPKPENPNLILPGMKMEIPSIKGEFRDGVYSPDVQYEPFGSNK